MGERVTNAQILVEVEYIKRKVDEMHVVIHGNGNPKEGMTHRLTVLETIVERLEKILWMVGGAVIVAVVGAVFALIRTLG